MRRVNSDTAADVYRRLRRDKAIVMVGAVVALVGGLYASWYFAPERHAPQLHVVVRDSVLGVACYRNDKPISCEVFSR